MAKEIKFCGLDDVMSDFEQMRDSDHYFSLFLACNPATGELYSMLVRPFESPALPAEYSIKLLTGQEMTRAQVIRYFTREIEAREAAAAKEQLEALRSRYNEKVKEQILAIRDTGLTNMLDVNTVQRLAYEKDFYELALYLENHPKEYVIFILASEA